MASLIKAISNIWPKDGNEKTKQYSLYLVNLQYKFFWMGKNPIKHIFEFFFYGNVSDCFLKEKVFPNYINFWDV